MSTTFFASNINPFQANGLLQTTSQSFVQGNTAFSSTTQAKRNVGALTFTGSVGGGLPVEAQQQNLELFTPTTFNPLAESNATFEILNKKFIEQVGGVTSADDIENINLFELQQLNGQLSLQSAFYNALQGIFNASFDQVQVSLNEILVIKQLREDNIKLAQQLAALEADYQHLKETCADIAGDDFVEQALETSINFGTSVSIHFSILYSVYQYFFGYPSDGIFDDIKVDLIRETLEDNGIFVNEEKEIRTVLPGDSS